jgi:hypothetical protein
MQSRCDDPLTAISVRRPPQNESNCRLLARESLHLSAKLHQFIKDELDIRIHDSELRLLATRVVDVVHVDAGSGSLYQLNRIPNQRQRIGKGEEQGWTESRGTIRGMIRPHTAGLFILGLVLLHGPYASAV